MTAIARFKHVSPAQFARDAAGFAQAMAVEDIPLPRRATPGSAGYDFACPVAVTLLPGQQAVIPTGIRVVMAPGWVLLNCPRSSLGRRHGLRLANTVGVIDGDYAQAENEGHILVALVNGGDHPVTLAPGERFCQGLLLPIGLAEESAPESARTGGFGSTGT